MLFSIRANNFGPTRLRKLAGTVSQSEMTRSSALKAKVVTRYVNGIAALVFSLGEHASTARTNFIYLWGIDFRQIFAGS